jgi:FkbM family methyltransferase
MGADVNLYALPEGSPLTHRIARRATVYGIRGHERYWRTAERLHAIPANPAIQIGARQLPLDLDEFLHADLYRGLYERTYLESVKKLVQRGALVIDVGANIGFYTLLFSALVGASGRVVAIEPQTELAEKLRHFAPANVEVHEVAAGRSTGTGTLHTLPDHSVLATLRTDGVDGWETHAVPVVPLDELVGSVESVGFLKIDAECAEEDVLIGAVQTLSRTDAFMVEVSANQGHVAEQLSAHGHFLFRVEAIRGPLRWQWREQPTSSSAIARICDEQQVIFGTRVPPSPAT